MNPEHLNKIFTYRPPKGSQPDRYTAIRAYAKTIAGVINELCPDGFEKEIAILKLRECVMWANAAIALEDTAK